MAKHVQVIRSSIIDDMMATHSSNETHSSTSMCCEYKISHLHIAFTKIHFLLKIFGVQLQCIPCNAQKRY